METPPGAPPNNSPNLETGWNKACDVLLKLLASDLTDIIPIRIALSALFIYSTNVSLDRPVAASVKLSYTFWPYWTRIKPVGNK